MSHGADASKMITASGREAGGASRRCAESQPVACRHANSYSTVLASPSTLAGDRHEQHLFDRPLNGAQAEALLEQAIRGVLVKRAVGAGQP